MRYTTNYGHQSVEIIHPFEVLETKEFFGLIAV